MKKIIFAIIAIIAIAGVVAFNVSLSTKKADVLSLLTLANVEAHANNEYVIGPILTNWKTYRIECERTVGFDYVLVTTTTTKYWKDACGYGAGLCLAPAGC